MLLDFLFKRKPKQLKDYLKAEFPEALVQVNMPNVGTYKPGSRTKTTTTTTTIITTKSTTS